MAVGGLRAATQECWGLAHILNLPYGPASWDPGWEPRRSPVAGSPALQAAA